MCVCVCVSNRERGRGVCDISARVSLVETLSQPDHHRLLSSQVIHHPHPQNHSDMGMSYRQYLAGARIYGCSTCKTHLATIHSMLSRVSPVALAAGCASQTIYISYNGLRLSTVSTAGRISLRECEISPVAPPTRAQKLTRYALVG